MKFSIEKQSLVGFGLASVVMVFINALSYWSLVQHRETAYRVAHTHEVEQKIEITLAEITEAETGQRGYILTGDDNYLKLYNDGIGSINQHIGKLQTLTADNPSTRTRKRTKRTEIPYYHDDFSRVPHTLNNDFLFCGTAGKLPR